jgi:hypothetical protein
LKKNVIANGVSITIDQWIFQGPPGEKVMVDTNGLIVSFCGDLRVTLSR